MDYDSALNETRTDGEQSETPAEFRISFESDECRVVYFIGAANGMVKIGFASDFNMRLSQLVCSSPIPLHPLAIHSGGRPEERSYHDRFAASRHHGEWFYLTDEIEAHIDRINFAQNPRYIPHRFRGLAYPLTLTNALRAQAPHPAR